MENWHLHNGRIAVNKISHMSTTGMYSKENGAYDFLFFSVCHVKAINNRCKTFHFCKALILLRKGELQSLNWQ